MIDCQPDHVAITGDIVNVASRQEIKNAATWLAQLDEMSGADTPITTIAGNHDAYVPGALKSVLREWQKFFSPVSKPNLEVSDFPLVRTQGNISIISCNSAEATLPFRATGYFRSDQAHRLSIILKEHENQFRIVLIHHLPVVGETADFKRLIGAERFTECIREHGAELVLHGHTHLQSLYWLRSPTGWTPVVGVSATAHAPGNAKPPGGFNLFEISGSNRDWKCQLKRFALSSDGNGQKIHMEKIDDLSLAPKSE